MKNKFADNKIRQEETVPFYSDKLWRSRAVLMGAVLLTAGLTLVIHQAYPGSIHKKMKHLKSSCEKVLPRYQDCVLDMQYVPKKG